MLNNQFFKKKIVFYKVVKKLKKYRKIMIKKEEVFLEINKDPKCKTILMDKPLFKTKL